MIFKFNFIEKMLLRFNVIPHPLNDVAVNTGLAKALGTAVKLKITDQLTLQPQPIAAIAQGAGVSEKGTEIILNCLEALGYVDKTTAGFAFNKRGAKFLDKASSDNFCYFILFSDWTYDSFSNLDKSIQAGQRPDLDFNTFGEYEWELFSRAMTELAKAGLGEVISKIKLPANSQHLLDLGGSHGLFSIELCKKYPTLQADVVDYEPVRKYAEENIQQAGLQDRVQFKAYDFMQEPIPGDRDAVLLFQIIHGHSPEVNQGLFQKIHAALRPGGQMIIHEQVKGISGSSQLAKANTSFIALNLFHQTNGNTYTFEEVSQWAQAAGFQKQTLKKLNSPGFGVIVCEK